MRVQVYPAHGVAFVGTTTVEIDGSVFPGRDFAEFRSTDADHPYHAYIAHLLPEELSAEARIVSGQPRRTGLCWAQTRYDGRTRINTFTFDAIGDRLPWHTHTEDDVHTSRVLAGEFTLRTESGQRSLTQGDFIDWQAGEWHEFTATEAGSVLENRVKKPVG